jgi:hypothetical protein
MLVLYYKGCAHLNIRVLVLNYKGCAHLKIRVLVLNYKGCAHLTIRVSNLNAYNDLQGYVLISYDNVIKYNGLIEH